MKQQLAVIEGNIRILTLVDPQHYVVETTDGTTLYGKKVPNLVPNKGKLSNALTAFWFTKIEKELNIPTVFESVDNFDMPKNFQTKDHLGRCMLVHKVDMLAAKFIVRGFLAENSPAFETYQKTGQICGIKLPAGIKANQQLKRPIFTPTITLDDGTEKDLTFDDLCELVGTEVAQKTKEYSIKIYQNMASYAYSKYLIFADTTFRFGIDDNGQVVLAAECLTPDTTRIWDRTEYQRGLKTPTQYDKEFILDYLIGSGWKADQTIPELPQQIIDRTHDKYVEVYDWLTGRSSHYVIYGQN